MNNESPSLEFLLARIRQAMLYWRKQRYDVEQIYLPMRSALVLYQFIGPLTAQNGRAIGRIFGTELILNEPQLTWFTFHLKQKSLPLPPLSLLALTPLQDRIYFSP